MRDNNHEIGLMKTRVQRDLKAHDRYIEQKQFAFKTQVEVDQEQLRQDIQY